MSDQYEPVRWLDDPDAGAALRADLTHGIGVAPTGIDYSATLLSLRGAIAAQTASLPVAASGASLFSTGIKLAIGAALVTGIAVWATRGDDDVEAGRVAAARVDPAPAAEQRAPLVAAPEIREPVRGAAVVAPASPSRDTTDAIEILPPAEASTGDGDADGDRTERARAKRRTDVDDAAVERAGVGGPAASAGDADRYVREARLVAQARRTLATDPSRALELTVELEREFPDGLLEEERRALAIRALTQLGRAEQARTAAKSFLAEFPDGPHAAAVRRAIEPGDTTP